MFASKINERDFIRKFLRTRNEEMFRKIYQQHTPRLYQLALRMLHWSQPDAEDALQELWIRAINRLSEFRWESNFHTWLTGILIHCCQEILRKRLPAQIENHLQMVPEPGTSSYDAIALENAIALLPEGYRTVVLLHDLEGYTHEEIAQVLGIDAGTSKSQLHHARRELRALLGETEEKTK